MFVIELKVDTFNNLIFSLQRRVPPLPPPLSNLYNHMMTAQASLKLPRICSFISDENTSRLFVIS